MEGTNGKAPEGQYYPTDPLADALAAMETERDAWENAIEHERIKTLSAIRDRDALAARVEPVRRDLKRLADRQERLGERVMSESLLILRAALTEGAQGCPGVSANSGGDA